jgi:hypothetical protein
MKIKDTNIVNTVQFCIKKKPTNSADPRWRPKVFPLGILRFFRLALLPVLDPLFLCTCIYYIYVFSLAVFEIKRYRRVGDQ